jgi:hypothetical protein
MAELVANLRKAMAGKNAPTVAKRMKKYWTKESENK